MEPNMHHNLFSIEDFVRTYTHNSKTTVIYGCALYWMTALLSKMFIFCVRVQVGCKTRLVSYDSKHASYPLSDKPFVCAYTLNLKTTGRIWMFGILNNCPTIRDIPCLVWSYKKHWTWDLWPQTCISHSLIQHCVFILQAYRYIAIWRSSMHDNKTHIPYDCTLHTKPHRYCHQCIVFIRKN